MLLRERGCHPNMGLLRRVGQDLHPYNRECPIDYKKPCKTDLIIDMSMSEEEAAEKIKPIDERGRGRYPLDIPVCDTEGNECAELHMTYYLYTPAPLSFDSFPNLKTEQSKKL